MPGVLGNEASVVEESFGDGLLEYPQYTRPARFRGWDVPEVLLSGDHGRVDRWRRAQALARTVERRPDLIAARGGLSASEIHLLEAHGMRGALVPPAVAHPAPDGIADGPPPTGPLDDSDSTPTPDCTEQEQSLRLAPTNFASEASMNPTDLIDIRSLRSDVPEFAPGDKVRVHVRVVEGNRTRTQVFEGVVIRRRGSGVRETFTVRKMSFGVGVERTFPVHTPVVGPDRAHHPRRCAPGQAVLPARPGGQTSESEREAIPLNTHRRPGA